MPLLYSKLYKVLYFLTLLLVPLFAFAPNWLNGITVFIWVSRVDKCISLPIRVDLKTCETDKWVMYRYITNCLERVSKVWNMV